MNIQKTANNIYAYNKLSGSLKAWQVAEVKRMIRVGIRAGIRYQPKPRKTKREKFDPRDVSILGGDPSL